MAAATPSLHPSSSGAHSYDERRRTWWRRRPVGRGCPGRSIAPTTRFSSKPHRPRSSGSEPCGCSGELPRQPRRAAGKGRHPRHHHIDFSQDLNPPPPPPRRFPLYLEALRKFGSALDEERKGTAAVAAGVRDANKHTALHFAACEGWTEVYRFLVEQLRLPVDPKDDEEGGETRPAPRQQLQRSRRKLLQADSGNLGGALPPAAANSSSCASKCSDRGRRDRRVVNKAEAIAPDATGIWRIICRMVEQDICGINWQARGGGDIAAEMGSEILDQLIWEQTAELMQLTVV